MSLMPVGRLFQTSGSLTLEFLFRNSVWKYKSLFHSIEHVLFCEIHVRNTGKRANFTQGRSRDLYFEIEFQNKNTFPRSVKGRYTVELGNISSTFSRNTLHGQWGPSHCLTCACAECTVIIHATAQLHLLYTPSMTDRSQVTGSSARLIPLHTCSVYHNTTCLPCHRLIGLSGWPKYATATHLSWHRLRRFGSPSTLLTIFVGV